MTLVSIVGDFHSSILPLFYHFSQDISKHVIIYDDFRRDVTQAQKIIKGTQAYIQKHQLDITTYTLEVDEDSFGSIWAIIDKLLEIESDPKELLINATDGLANIALMLSHKLLDKGIRFLIYDRFDNSYNILSKDAMLSISINDSISIEEHFLLKNIDIIALQDTHDAHTYEREIAELFEVYDGKKSRYQKRSAEANEMINTTQTGFLYEYYIYNLLRHLNHDDIRLGVAISDTYTQNSSINNELDILIMKNNHLHMIECKFRDDLKKVDLIYKADSVRQTLDDEAKVIILSNEEIYDFENDIEHVLPRYEYKRAHAKQIYFRGFPGRDIERFLREVDAIFNLKTPNIDEVVEKVSTKQHKDIEFLKSFFSH